MQAIPSPSLECVLVLDGDVLRCTACGSTYPGHLKRLHAQCKAGMQAEIQMIPEPPPQEGPGTELKALLAKFGIHASPTCKCNSMARKMNDMESREPGWCLSHIEEIVDVMEETAKARKLPFLRTAGRLLVKKAVKNWHKKATGK